MDKNPSGIPKSSEHDYFYGLEAEMQNFMLDAVQDQFMDAVYNRSTVIDAMISTPEDKSLLIALKESHENSLAIFNKYIQEVFVVSTDAYTRKKYIVDAFIVMDYLQTKINQIIDGEDTEIDPEVLTEELDEILKSNDGNVEEKVIEKFKMDFDEDLTKFLGSIHPEKDVQWTNDNFKVERK